MLAIFGYTFRGMSAEPRISAVAPVDEETTLRLAGALSKATAMLSVSAEEIRLTSGLAKVALDPRTVLKAKLFAECADGLGADVDRGRVAELLLDLEALNETKAPATSKLLQGKWRFLYATGASPALQALQLMLKGSQAIPKAPFGPAPVDIDDTYLTISAQGHATASTKVRMLALETTLKLQSKLEAASPVRLMETYESAGSTPVGLFPVQVPALPYKRPVLVSYLDETLLIVRDASGRPDVLTRVNTIDVDADDYTPIIPQVVTEAATKIGEAVEGFVEEVSPAVEEAAAKIRDALKDLEAKVTIVADDMADAAAEKKAAVFKKQAEELSEIAAYYKALQADLDKLAGVGEAEARAFFQAKAENLQQAAAALFAQAAVASNEAKETIFEQQAVHFQREADALTKRAESLEGRAQAMWSRVAMFDESASDAEKAEARRILQDQRESERYLAAEIREFTTRAAERAEEAAAEEDRAEFFNAQEKPEKKKRRLFGFLRRKGKKAAAEIESKVELGKAAVSKAVEEEKAALGKAVREEKASLGKAVSDEEAELRAQAIEVTENARERLREEKEKAEETVAEIATGLDEWRAYVKDEAAALENATAEEVAALGKVGLDTVEKAAEKVEEAVKSGEKRVEKAIKKRGLFGFLSRKKDGKAKAKKKMAKKGRETGRNAKRGPFGFLRRKKTVGDSEGIDVD
jgi:hypothetical protein